MQGFSWVRFTCKIIRASETHTHTHPFNGPFSRTTRVSRYQKGKTNLDFTEQETVSGSGISWAMCKSASRSRQITMPVPHHSSFLQAGCPSSRPTNSIKALKAKSIWDSVHKLAYHSQNDSTLILSYVLLFLCLQCFDAVGWATGRASGLKKLSGGVLTWLFVWSEMQTCIWPSWCHCHSLSLASVKSRLVLPFWYQLTQVVPVKGPSNVCVYVCIIIISIFIKTYNKCSNVAKK